MADGVMACSGHGHSGRACPLRPAWLPDSCSNSSFIREREQQGWGEDSWGLSGRVTVEGASPCRPSRRGPEPGPNSLDSILWPWEPQALLQLGTSGGGKARPGPPGCPCTTTAINITYPIREPAGPGPQEPGGFGVLLGLLAMNSMNSCGLHHKRPLARGTQHLSALDQARTHALEAERETSYNPCCSGSHEFCLNKM